MEWENHEILRSKVITKSRNWEEEIDGSYNSVVNNNSSAITASVGSGEPFIGLKLGKRTYFEAKNNNSKTTTTSSSFSGSTTKKAKLSCQSTPVPRCQVEGCNLDLSSSKEYHRKHRVCETHSKFPKVVVGHVGFANSVADFTVCQSLTRRNGAVVDGFQITMQGVGNRSMRLFSLIQQTYLHHFM